MYKQVISLGFFCSVALEMQRIGIRSQSGPFDWVISDLNGVISLIENHFQDLLNPSYLVQDVAHPYIYTNQKYNLAFFHDFNPSLPMINQLQGIQEKYTRRIERFYKAISEPTLFIRYIKDQAEYNLICTRYWNILNTFRAYNKRNDLLFIINSDIQVIQRVPIKLYVVEKDARDVVARQFLDKNIQLMNYLRGPIIPDTIRFTNKQWAAERR